MSPHSEGIEEWLRAFAKAVRERDFSAGRALFSPSVVSFGTAGYRLDNLEELVSRQWRCVWPKTADFDFNYDRLHVIEEGGLALIAAEWASVGLGKGETPHRRSGRASLALQRIDGRWKAVHTHFSMGPVDPLL